MTEKQGTAKQGRPRVQIDQQQFENLCKLQCTVTEIAGWFSCSVDTIERWCKRTYKLGFKDVYAVYSEAGKISLRRAQWQMAQTNPSMAIFLGKNYLGQSDDPRKYAREETTEDKIDKLLEALTAVVYDDNSDNTDEES